VLPLPCPRFGAPGAEPERCRRDAGAAAVAPGRGV